MDRVLPRAEAAGGGVRRARWRSRMGGMLLVLFVVLPFHTRGSLARASPVQGDEPEVPSEREASAGGPIVQAAALWDSAGAGRPEEQAIIGGARPVGETANSRTSSDARTSSLPVAAIEVAKTPEIQHIHAGASAVFTITVANTGDSLLNSIEVSDASAPQCDAAYGDLAPGERRAHTCVVPAVADSFVNVVDVRAIATDGHRVSDSDEAAVMVHEWAIVVEKAPDLQVVEAGGAARFAITVRNTGLDALEDVVVEDPLAPACSRTLGILAPGDSVSYECAVHGVAAPFTNVVTAKGLAPTAEIVSHSDDALVRVASLAVDKRIGIGGQSTWQKADAPPGPSVLVGTPVWFLLSLENRGDVAIEDVTLTDSVYDLSDSPECWPPSILFPGDSFDCVVGPMEASQGQHLNGAVAVGQVAGMEVRASDDVYYLGHIPSGPAVSVQKYVAVDGGEWLDADTPDAAPTVSAGSKGETELVFRIMVANTGAVPLEDLRIEDPVLGLGAQGRCAPPSTLAPGEGYGCTVSAVHAAPCLQTNVVTATAVYAGVVYSDSDPVYYYGVPCGVALDHRVFLPLVLSECCPDEGARTSTVGDGAPGRRGTLGAICPP